MKIRPSQIYYIYNNNEYALGDYANGETPNTRYHFISMDERSYPSEILLMREISFAYNAIIKIIANECEVIVKEFVGENVVVRMTPGSSCIERLNAYSVDGGSWYEAIVPKKVISSIWEEHYPVDGYVYPPDLNFIEPIEI